MKHHLHFDFTVNKENNTIQVDREFNAKLPIVWQAWTDPKILDQWWAPKPWKAETKTMDFREGGYWFYAMLGPQGERHWCKADYHKIEHEKSFRAKDGFTDEDGVINTDFPQNYWDTKFSAQGNRSMVRITLTFDKLEDLEKTIEMGFEEGFTAGLQNLDDYLENQSQSPIG